MSAKIGVITEEPEHTRRLKGVLEGAGYDVVAALEPGCDALAELAQAQPDAWVVSCSGDECPGLDQLLVRADAPVLFGDAIPEEGEPGAFARWADRLLEKVQCMAVAAAVRREAGDEGAPAGQPEQDEPAEPPRQVWVLAASLGGPAAVGIFLRSLPRDLPVAFVYAQHIDQQFEPMLARALANSPFAPVVMEHGHRLRHGQVSIVPVNREVSFSPCGEVSLGRRAWSGPYKPAIDQVLADVGRAYRGHSGCIVFSGMGADGQLGARIMHNSGGAVWVQRPESCTSASMPNAVASTGCVSRMGDPEQLADALTRMVQDGLHD